MRLRKSENNELEFKKKREKDIHAFSFGKFIQFVIDDIRGNNEDSSSSAGKNSEMEEESENEEIEKKEEEPV